MRLLRSVSEAHFANTLQLAYTQLALAARQLVESSLSYSPGYALTVSNASAFTLNWPSKYSSTIGRSKPLA
jgi:hypothetical protein